MNEPISDKTKIIENLFKSSKIFLLTGVVLGLLSRMLLLVLNLQVIASW